MLDRPWIRIRLLHIGCRRSPRHCAVDLYLDIGKLKHAPLGLLPEFRRMLDFCHRIMTFRLEYLIRGIDMHMKLSLHIKLMTGKRGIVSGIPVDDGI